MPVPTLLRAARIRARGLALSSVLITVTALAACSDPKATADPKVERGRQIYLAQCIACHNPDPTLAGPLGPAAKGSSPELLELKILKGTYPSGYTPKRPTTLMPPQPALAPEIPNLAAYLK